MKLNDIRTLYDYLFWAHERMMAPVLELTPEEFARDLGFGHGSVRDTLAHMMSCEWMWLSRWHGISPSGRLDPGAFPVLAALEDRWGRIRIELQRFLGQVREEDLVHPLEYRSPGGEDIRVPLVCTLEHVVHHNTYHRGQVAVLLRRLGREPPSTDLIGYYLEEEGGAFARPLRRWEQVDALVRSPGAGRGPGGEEDEH